MVFVYPLFEESQWFRKGREGYGETSLSYYTTHRAAAPSLHLHLTKPISGYNIWSIINGAIKSLSFKTNSSTLLAVAFQCSLSLPLIDIVPSLYILFPMVTKERLFSPSFYGKLIKEGEEQRRERKDKDERKQGKR